MAPLATAAPPQVVHPGGQALDRPGMGKPAVAVAVSGGADSLALLWVVWQQATGLGLKTHAFHVHHGLQAAADAWPDRLAQEVRRWSQMRPQWPAIDVRTERLRGRPARGDSVEEWARDARYRALASMAHACGVDLVLLAHHRRDQAETFLLQALRGAGPQGLAAMPRLHTRSGVCFARPWLAMPRESVRRLALDEGLRTIDDPSNDDPRWARNRLRQAVWPALSRAFEEVEATLAQSAQRCAQALEPLEQGVQADLQRCMREARADGRRVRLELPSWQTLTPARRSWVLRMWLQRLGLSVSSRVIDRLAAHDFSRAGAARWPVGSGHELRWYRRHLSVEPMRLDQGGGAAAAGDLPPREEALTLRRSGRTWLPGWEGWILLRRAAQGEPGLAQPLPLNLLLRPRHADDRFQLAPRGLARALKKQYQARAVPAWDRKGPVVTTQDGVLVLVAGLGLDARVVEPQGRWVLEWLAPDRGDEPDADPQGST